MQQRIAVVQSLIMKPKILLMDEPFGALDPGSRENIQLFLLELWEETDITILFVTHDLEEACYLGTRLIVVSQYYCDDRNLTVNGAKIVGDFDLGKDALSTSVKYRLDFGEMIRYIREIGFKQEHRVHVREFDLKHKDSFQHLFPVEDIGLINLLKTDKE